jgi:polyhydroxyalkanoate synthesis regulator phasin
VAQSRSGGSKSGSGKAKTSAKSKSSSASSSRSASSRKAAAAKGGQARARQQKSRKAASSTAKTAARGARGAGVEAKTVAEFREALRKNLIRPMEMVMLSRDRIEEVLGEAVDQGRVTARDAQRITAGLVKRGQKQTSDVLKDLEQLMGRGRDEIEGRTSGARKRASGAAKGASGAAKGARSRAVRTASPALAQVDKVRRTAGVGPNFPILGYDDLTASQVQGRLNGLTPAQLRKVRDHERRNANRKTVLNAIESKLG